VQGLSKQLKRRIWLLTVGVAILIIGASYTIAQQSTRLAANDTPLATAQTVKHELENGAAPSNTTIGVKTDLSSDSTVFVIVTDSSSHILASSARLNGQTPLPPAGVFSYTQVHGADHFTWQPASGIRLATEVQRYGGGNNSGFVITGQSLSQAESRINTYGYLALAAIIGVIAWTSVLIYWPPELKSSETKKKR